MYYNRIIQVGKSFRVSSSPNSCLKECQLWYQTRLLRLLFNWVLKKDGNGKTFLDTAKCPHGVKASHYTQPEPLLFQLIPIVSHPPSMHHCEKPVSVLLITSLYKLSKPCSLASLHGTSVPGLWLDLHELINLFFLLEGSKLDTIF